VSEHLNAVTFVSPLHSSAKQGWHYLRDLFQSLLIGGVVRVKYLLRMAEITSGNSFELNNLRNLFLVAKNEFQKSSG